MIDSLRYGLPFGMASFLAYALHLTYFVGIAPLLRWGVVGALGVGLVLNMTKSRNIAYFPFRFAFLSAFNALYVATISNAAMMFIFQDWIIKGELPDGVSQTKWTLFLIFQEGMGFIFMGIICAVILSLILRKNEI